MLLKSEPETGAVLSQPPERVTGWFSEELDTHLSTIQVLNKAGQQVDQGDGGVDLNDPEHASLMVTLPPALSSGAYTAHWVAVSAEDGDTTEGEFTFQVGQTDTPTKSAAPLETVSIASSTDWLVISMVAGLAVLLLISMYFFWRSPSNQVR
ncbi:MAG: copper resistance protein CopC [Anaerolineae bacterium]